MISKLTNYIKKNQLIKNYFNTEFKRNVLISYIVSPFFRKGENCSHSNQIEVIKIADIFKEVKFNIDIINYDYYKKINYEKYDIIFGLGNAYENALKNKNKEIIYIYYATGSYFCFQNASEINRLVHLYKRRNILLEPKRFINYPKYLATQLSDAIIITGNDYTVSTYINSKMPIYKVPISVYSFFNYKEIHRDINKAKRHFLWFGSSGLVHKGLDICLEVFKEFSEYALHICGPKEDDFFEIYKNELNLNNIHYHGFIDVSSTHFKDIVSQCLFTIFPSSSEGMSGSLLTTMATGLIPIATKETGINIEDRGFLIDSEINLYSIKKLIEDVVLLPKKKLVRLSNSNGEYIMNNHTLKNFEESFKKNLLQILGR